MIRHLNDSNYESEISKTKGISVVDFYATWCGPCMMLAPVLEEISNSRTGYNIMKIDVDSNPDTANALNVDTIPTILIYKDGKLLDRKIGYMSKNELLTLIEKYNG